MLELQRLEQEATVAHRELLRAELAQATLEEKKHLQQVADESLKMLQACFRKLGEAQDEREG